MKKILLVIFVVILLAATGGIVLLYAALNDPANREGFVSAFVASGKPSFVKNCIESAHRTAPNKGPEIDKKIEDVCNCAADKMMASITSQKSSLSGMGTAIYRMMFDSAFQQETAMQCLQE